MDNKSQYLVFTRFYKGEAECPEHIKKRKNGEFYWDVERGWVEDAVNHRIDTGCQREYLAYVKPDVPAEYGIPLSLLAYIFIRAGKMAYSMSDFGAKFAELIKTDYLTH